jgi:hypothetical protein
MCTYLKRKVNKTKHRNKIKIQTNNQTNKQTNKPTNKPTNNLRYNHSRFDLCYNWYSVDLDK